MLAFRIEVDGQPFVTAGVEDWSVLTFAVVAGRRVEGRDEADELHTTVGGMAADSLDHLRWRGPGPSLGTRITLEIVDTDKVDPPLKRFASDTESPRTAFTAEQWREKRHEAYLELKAEFEP